MAATVLVLASCLYRLVMCKARRGARHARPPIRRAAAPRTAGTQAARLLSGIPDSRAGRYAARMVGRGMAAGLRATRSLLDTRAGRYAARMVRRVIAPGLRVAVNLLDTRPGRFVTRMVGQGTVPGLPVSVARSLAASAVLAIAVIGAVLATQLGGSSAGASPALRAGTVMPADPLVISHWAAGQEAASQRADGQQAATNSGTAAQQTAPQLSAPQQSGPQQSAPQNGAQSSGSGQGPAAQQARSGNGAGAKQTAARAVNNRGRGPQGKAAARAAAPAWPVWNQLLPAAVSSPQSSMPVGSDQLQNAKTILDEAGAMHMGNRSAVIAIATAMQESKLENLDYGDQDSLGLFQQRPSAGWGSPDQITNPQYAAWAFLNALWNYQRSNPGWATQSLWMPAQGVQQSAFPDAYEQWEQEAAYIVWYLER